MPIDTITVTDSTTTVDLVEVMIPGLQGAPGPMGDITNATPAGQAILTNSQTACQFGLSGNSISITSPVGDESAIKFYNSSTAGLGGRVFEIGSTIAGTTGTPPFVFGAVEFNVNDDASRDFNVFFGHGFNSSGGLAAGATWGAVGLVSEGHYNPNPGVNQSETYFRVWSLQAGGTEYRPFYIGHNRHELSDGKDSILTQVNSDSHTFNSKTSGTNRVTIDATNFTIASGLTVSVGGGGTTFNATTGMMVTTGINTAFNPALSADGAGCVFMGPTVTLSASTAQRGAYVSPTWAGGHSLATFLGYGVFALPSKAAGFVYGYQADCGVNGAVTVGTATAFRTNPQCYTGTVTTMIGFHAQSITNTGTVTNGYGLKIENHTGHHAIHTGTGSYRFGDASADTKFGFHAATPVAQQTVAAAATDEATAITLANSMRTLGINLGIWKA